MDIEFVDSFRQPKLHGNFIMDISPFFKLNLVVLIAATAAIFGHVFLRIAAIALYFVLAWLSGNFKKFSWLYIRVGTILIAFIFVLQSAFKTVGTHALFEWGIVRVTAESIAYGISFSLLVVEICGAVMLFYNITPMKDLAFALEMLGISHSASYVLLAAMQTILDLQKSTKVIMESQSARGVETTGNLITRFKAFIPILGPLMLSAISSTEEKNIAMDTRAFSCSAKPTHVYELRKSPLPHKLVFMALNLLFVVAVVWRILA